MRAVCRPRPRLLGPCRWRSRSRWVVMALGGVSRQAMEALPCQHHVPRGQLHGGLLSWDWHHGLTWPYPAAGLFLGGVVRGSGHTRPEEKGRVLSFLVLAALPLCHQERPLLWASATLAPYVSRVTCRSCSCTFRRQSCMQAAFLWRLWESTSEGLGSSCRGGLSFRPAVALPTYRSIVGPR